MTLTKKQIHFSDRIRLGIRVLERIVTVAGIIDFGVSFAAFLHWRLYAIHAHTLWSISDHFLCLFSDAASSTYC
jgi:hypothetical protein